MTEWNTEDLIAADKKFAWHPFTNMRDWCAPELSAAIAAIRDSIVDVCGVS
jgi:hypothetical protein